MTQLKQSGFFILFVLLLGTPLLSSCTSKRPGPSFTKSNTGPYILNMDHLQWTKENLNDPVLQYQFNKLISGADRALSAEIRYIPEKPFPPRSGNYNDYLSLSRYSWPNPSRSDNQPPFIIRDGITNPEIENYDRPKLAMMSSAVYTLSLAYFFTDDERYAERAASLLKNWFLNEETRMNPNLNFAQVQWPVDEGDGSLQGIIDANDLIRVIEAVSLIYDTPYWTPNNHLEMKEWVYDFFSWIMDNYTATSFSTTNVSNWLDVQKGVYLMFTEQEGRLNSGFHMQPVKERIQIQFEQDGYQTHEATRGRAQHYVYFNLRAYMKLSLLRKNQFNNAGFDRDWPVLKECVTEECELTGLKNSLDSLASFIDNREAISLFTIENGFNRCRYLEIFRPAALAFDNQRYEEIVQKLVFEGCSAPEILLAYPSIHRYSSPAK